MPSSDLDPVETVSRLASTHRQITFVTGLQITGTLL